MQKRKLDWIVVSGILLLLVGIHQPSCFGEEKVDGNLAVNAGFEEFFGNANDSVPDKIPGWGGGGGKKGWQLEIVTEAHSGSYALKFGDVSDDIFTHSSSLIDVGQKIEGKTFIASAWFKNIDGKAAFIGIRAYPTRKNARYKCVEIPSDNQWHKVECKLKVKPSTDTEDTKIEILLSGQSAETERKPSDKVSILIDDVEVKMVSEEIPVQIIVPQVGKEQSKPFDGGENIALGKKYTMSVRPSYQHRGNPMCTDEGDKVQLTNGVLSKNRWWDKETVGFLSGKPFDITIDLEKAYPIEGVAVRAESVKDGRYFPKEIVLLVSDDLKTYYVAGKTKKRTSEVQGKFYHWFKIDKLRTKGRYVVVKIYPDRGFIPLDEIMIFKGTHRIEDVSFKEQKPLPSTMWRPFYGEDKAYISKTVAIPLHLKREEHELAVDLPKGIYPVPKSLYSSSQRIKIRSEDYDRYYSKYLTKYLFFESSLPYGAKKDIHLQRRIEEGRILEQWITLEVIEIEPAPLPKHLFTCVGWQRSDLYLIWPHFLQAYRSFGLNTLSFAAADVSSPVPNPLLDTLIKSAKEQGLFVVGNFSPLNLNPSYIKRNPALRKAVDVTGKAFLFPCPLEYRDNILYGELSYLRRGISHGIYWYWFDSETSYPKNICFCDVCRKRFKEIMQKEHSEVPYKDPLIFEKEPEKYPELHKLWLEAKERIGIEITSRFHEGLQKELDELSLDPSPEITIDFYGFVPDGRYDNQFLKFNALYRAGCVTHAMPVCYNRSPLNVAEFISENKRMAPGVEMIAWMPTRQIPDIGKDWESQSIKKRLLALFANGGMGFSFQTMSGFDGLDYKYLSEAMRMIVPVEEIIAGGTLLDKEGAKIEDNAVKVCGMFRDNETILFLMDFQKESCHIGFNVRSDSYIVDLETKEVIGELRKGKKSFVARPGKDGISFYLIFPKKRLNYYLKPISLYSHCSKDEIVFQWFPNAIAVDKYVFQYSASKNFDGNTVILKDLKDTNFNLKKDILNKGFRYWRVGAVQKGKLYYSEPEEIAIDEIQNDFFKSVIKKAGVPPQIRLINLKEGQKISGEIAVEVEVHGMPVKRVKFFIDGEKVHQEGGAPYFLFGDYNKWNTATYANGSHSLKIIAVDHMGKSISKEIKVTIENPE